MALGGSLELLIDSERKNRQFYADVVNMRSREGYAVTVKYGRISLHHLLKLDSA